MSIEQQRVAVEEITAYAPEPNGSGTLSDAHEVSGPPRTVLREYFESLVVTAIMAIFGMTFIVLAVKVPTGSMQNTILIGDHLLVNKFIFAPGPLVPFLPQREIRRGDVIVFKYPGKFQDEERFRDNAGVDDTQANNLPFKTNYVKRVIGLAGDLVEIRGTQVLINGQPLNEHRISARNPPDDESDTIEREDGAPLEILESPVPSLDEPSYNVYWDDERQPQSLPPRSEKFVVPEGHYFVLGDNRSHSQDGRYWGYVPRELIIGRAMFVYWSFDESLPRSEIMFPLNLVADFVANTRWSRTGTLVR
jgi:signal peptidase I